MKILVYIKNDMISILKRLNDLHNIAVKLEKSINKLNVQLKGDIKEIDEIIKKYKKVIEFYEINKNKEVRDGRNS